MSFLNSQTIKTPLQQMEINNNINYRMYLKQNAKHIIKTNSNKAFIELGTSPYNKNQLVNNKIFTYHNPYIYQSSFDNTELSTCIPPTQMKKKYLEKKQIQLRMIAPSITINDIDI